jgi:protein gp37
MGSDGTVSVSEDLEVFLDRERFMEVLSRKKPTKWFWADMTDIFASWVPDEWIDECFAVMALTPQHVHQVLTKRSERMPIWATEAPRRVADIIRNGGAKFADGSMNLIRAFIADARNRITWWPLPNVWLGVSAEDQLRADERIPHLLRTPAAVRFVSFEPLLEEINTDKFFWRPITEKEAANLKEWGVAIPKVMRSDSIYQAIIGGESGPNHRTVPYSAIRSLWQQCRDAGVPVFVKQDAGPKPGMQGRIEDEVWASKEFPKLR